MTLGKGNLYWENCLVQRLTINAFLCQNNFNAKIDWWRWITCKNIRQMVSNLKIKKNIILLEKCVGETIFSVNIIGNEHDIWVSTKKRNQTSSKREKIKRTQNYVFKSKINKQIGFIFKFVIRIIGSCAHLDVVYVSKYSIIIKQKSWPSVNITYICSFGIMLNFNCHSTLALKKKKMKQF